MKNIDRESTPIQTPIANDVGLSLRSDEPIESTSQDLLSRGPLVQTIARQVIRYQDKNCLIISLNAPWGAGKSSFLNLLYERFKSKQSANFSPHLIRFNPWNFGNIDQLVRMFFDELVGAMKKDKKIHKKIGKLFNALGSLVTTTAPINPLFSRLTGWILKKIGSTLEREDGLHILKSKIDKLLREHGRRMIVFIDDVDRLEADVARLLFRMIRLTASFPYLVYVLSFDRVVVENLLDGAYGIRGRDYLEKIVQVSFDIPSPESETIQGMLRFEIEQVIQSTKTREFDCDRWDGLFKNGFKDHFRTVREVRLFVNGLRLTLVPIAEEVNPVDFLGIELIRVFHPDLYRRLSESKGILTSGIKADLLLLSGTHPDRDPFETWIGEMCKLAPEQFRESVRSLLVELFPSVGRPGETRDSGIHVQWINQCRVCSPDVFEKYFLLSVPRSGLAEAYVDEFINALENKDLIRKTLNDALKSGKARALLERMQFRDELSKGKIRALIRLMCDHSDELVFEQRDTSDVSSGLVPILITIRCIRRLESDNDRVNVVLDVINHGKSLHAIARLISWIKSSLQEDGSDPIVTDTSQSILEQAASDRITSMIRNGLLWQEDMVFDILSYWLSWDRENMRKAVYRYVSDDRCMLHFLDRYMTDHNDGKILPIMDKESVVSPLSKLIDVDRIRYRLREIMMDNEEQKLHVESFMVFIDKVCPTDTISERDQD